MYARQLLPLLYASIAAILIILAVVVRYTLSQEEAFLSPVAIDDSTLPAAPIARAPAFKEGKALWQKHACGSCHNKNMKDDLTAPALGGVTERWAAYPREDLYRWIRSSQLLIAQKHPRALEVWSDWKPSVMSNYELTEAEIEALLAYIEAKP